MFTTYCNLQNCHEVFRSIVIHHFHLTYDKQKNVEKSANYLISLLQMASNSWLLVCFWEDGVYYTLLKKFSSQPFIMRKKWHFKKVVERFLKINAYASVQTTPLNTRIPRKLFLEELSSESPCWKSFHWYTVFWFIFCVKNFPTKTVHTTRWDAFWVRKG